MRRPAFVLFVLVGMFTEGVAGTTGKIAGKVLDVRTGEPLIGVNMLLEGTTIGAASDLNGNYVILSVPPGVYNLRASAIGCNPVTFENVRV